MKKCIFILSVLFLICVSVSAQDMRIRFKNGKVEKFNSADVISITYGKEPTAAELATDAVINQTVTFASMAQYYYKKPTAIGGGGNSFKGWNIQTVSESKEGTFTAAIENDLVTIVGTCKVKNENGKFTKVVVKFEKDTIKSVIIE
jgi:hypothetical protein